MTTRKTKIVCTLGPATDKDNVLREMIINNMNVCRFNFSHGSHEEHLERINRVKALRTELKVPLAILLDTKGPEIRVKKFAADKVELKEKQSFTLTTRDIEGDENSVSVTYAGLPTDVSVGDTILLDDGLIALKVKSIVDTDVLCEVVNGGSISNNKGVNVPGVKIKLPFVSEKDKSDIIFGAEQEVDYIAASFTRSAQDIRDIRKVLADHNGDDVKIIAKIENHEGVDNIDEIIQVSDGIMVARGDMGVEIPFEELPAIQKSILHKCYIAGKPAITATQMLDSMIRNPRPTRAEIIDIANAVYDNTSAVMLSGETAMGKYPLESLLAMSKIAIETEKNIDYKKKLKQMNSPINKNVTNAICFSTCESAHNLSAAAIISVTKSGHSTRMVAKYRPNCPIVGSTVSEKVYHQLALNWGVHPMISTWKDSTDEIFDQAVEMSTKAGIIKNGDVVIINGGMPASISGTTNTLKVHIVGDLLLEATGLNNLQITGTLCVASGEDGTLKHFNFGDIIVMKNSLDEILAAIKHAGAVITENKAADSPEAIIAKALDIPILIGAADATTILKSGTVVTVDSGSGHVFSGTAKISKG
jgi:pyruvate kinase